MDFRPLNDTERRQLIGALRGNAESNRVILLDRRDTSFAGTSDEITGFRPPSTAHHSRMLSARITTTETMKNAATAASR